MTLDSEEEALFFSSSNASQLFGVLHGCSNFRNAGAVFCHPWGEEKQKSYRPFVEFSRFLASNGICSLRFDCRGFGDSEGDAIEANLQTQIANTRDAVSLLTERFEIERVYLIGLRLGASISALLAEQDKRIAGIVLLSPIVDGLRYWNDLIRTQQFSALSRGSKAASKDQLLEGLEKNHFIEIEAQNLSAEMSSQISNLNLIESLGHFLGPVPVTGVSEDTKGHTDINHLVNSYNSLGGCAVAWLKEERNYWSSQCMYDAYIPQPTFDRVLSWIAS